MARMQGDWLKNIPPQANEFVRRWVEWNVVYFVVALISAIIFDRPWVSTVVIPLITITSTLTLVARLWFWVNEKAVGEQGGGELHLGPLGALVLARSGQVRRPVEVLGRLLLWNWMLTAFLYVVPLRNFKEIALGMILFGGIALLGAVTRHELGLNIGLWGAGICAVLVFFGSLFDGCGGGQEREEHQQAQQQRRQNIERPAPRRPEVRERPSVPTPVPAPTPLPAFLCCPLSGKEYCKYDEFTAKVITNKAGERYVEGRQKRFLSSDECWSWPLAGGRGARWACNTEERFVADFERLAEDDRLWKVVTERFGKSKELTLRCQRNITPPPKDLIPVVYVTAEGDRYPVNYREGGPNARATCSTRDGSTITVSYEVYPFVGLGKWQIEHPTRFQGKKAGYIIDNTTFRLTNLTYDHGRKRLDFEAFPSAGASVPSVATKFKAHFEMGPRDQTKRAEQTRVAVARVLSRSKPVDGVASQNVKSWPFALRIKSFNEQTGQLAGEMEWITLSATHAIEGTLSETHLAFSETSIIKQGQATLGSTYRFDLSEGGVAIGRLEGEWSGGGSDGPVSIELQ